MSIKRKRLVQVVREFQIRTGRNWKAKLSIRADVGTSTIDNILGNRTRPSGISPQLAFRVAVACGKKEQEALALASEYIQLEAKAG